MLVRLWGGEPRLVAKLAPDEEFIQWRADGWTVSVVSRGVRLGVFGIDVLSGKRRS